MPTAPHPSELTPEMMAIFNFLFGQGGPQPPSALAPMNLTAPVEAGGLGQRTSPGPTPVDMGGTPPDPSLLAKYIQAIQQAHQAYNVPRPPMQ